MTNSYFIPAPDYASILDKSFLSLNKSLAKQEAMERDNDRSKLQNAAVPLQIFEKIINLSTTAAKTVKETQAKKWLEAESKGASSAALSQIDDEYQQETDDAFQTGTEAYQLETKIERTALENDDTDIAEQQKFGVGHQVINARDLSVAYLDKLPTWWTSGGFDKKYNAAKTLQAKRSVIEEFKLRLTGVRKDNIPDRLYKKFVENKENTFFGNITNQGKQQIQEKITKERFAKMSGRLTQISRSSSETFLADISQFKEENRGAFKDDLKGATVFTLQHFLQGNQDGDIPPEKTEMLLDELTKSKTTGKLTPLKQIMKEQEVDDILEQVENFKKQLVQKNEAKVETDRKLAGQAFKREEAELLKNEGRRFTKDEIKEKIKEWRATSVHPLPEAYKTALSVEDLTEEEVVDQLNNKYVEKTPIYEEDLIGLQDPDKLRYWRSLVQSSESWAIPKNLQDEATESIKGSVDKYIGEEDGTKVKSPKWIAVKQNAERRYKQLYAEHIPNNTPDQAHLKALETIETEMSNQLYDKRASSKPENQYALNIELAHTAIAGNTNIINTAVIPGTEGALEQAIANPTVVPKLYEDIASKYKTMSPHDLMYAQMEAAGNKVEKDPITKEVEKLEPNVQQLLKHHPTHGRVARALLEEYQKDGEITYDDVEFLLEETLDQQLKDAGYVTPQLGEMKPETGDWQTLENGTYVVFDGEQWQQRGVFFTNKQPYIGNIEEYLDKDLVRRKF
tara:strand:- start:3837 stop:6047 length:2211 start_codon:yes stop_codon:yes gene_type:complete